DCKGELLYEICQTGDELNRALRATFLGRLGGPSHHGAVVFCKRAYERVGGYRSAFRVAQDLDLWTRLAEVGECLAMPDVLYEARLTYGSITHLNRQQQKRTAEIIVRCIQARREGCDEAQLLDDVKGIQSSRGWLFKRVRDAALNYFIGSMLRTRQPRRAH